MRHRFGNAKLKRDIGARNSLLKNLTTSVVLEERVITTVPKAKAVQPIVEKMITLAKADTLHTRRQAAAGQRDDDGGVGGEQEIDEEELKNDNQPGCAVDHPPCLTGSRCRRDPTS